MLTTLTSWLRPATRRRPRRETLVRPLEALEARAVPDATPFLLAGGAYNQSWTSPSSYAADWSAATQGSVQGYFGAGLKATTTGNAGTVTGASADLLLDLNPAQVAPSVYAASGVALFWPNQTGQDPMVALKPTPTSSPYLLFNLNTTGVGDVFVSYRLRDLDTSAASAESVSLQWRAGNTGAFQDVSNAYDANATTGADQYVFGRLPAGADGKPLVQVRVITTQPASGGAQWVGVDDITITGNKPPVVTPSGGNTVYQEPIGIGTTGRVQVDPNMTVTDLDQAALYDPITSAAGTLTVSVTTNAGPTDAVSINNQGTGNGQIGVITTSGGTTVAYAGTPIGTVTGLGTGTFTVTFNSFASLAAVQALARQVQFLNSSDTPGNTVRTIQFVFDDGHGGTTTATKGVLVQDRNDTPVLTLPGGGASTYEGIPVAITGVSVNDVDLLAGKLRLVVTVGTTPSGTIAYTKSGTETVTYNAANTQVTVLGTIAQLNAALSAGGLVFTPDPGFNTAGVLPVPLNFSLDDQGSTGVITDPTQPVLATVSVTVNQVNHPPVVTLDPPATGLPGDPVAGLDYPLNSAPVLVAPNATVTDPDYPKAADLNGGVLTVKVSQGASPDNLLRLRSEGFQPGQVGLQGAFPNTSVVYTFPAAGPGQQPLSVIVGTITSSGTGTLPLQVTFTSGYATPDVVQAVVRNVQFATTGSSYDPTPRTVLFDLTDGDGVGTPPSQTLASTFPKDLYYADNDTTRVINPLRVNNAPTFALATTTPTAVPEDNGPQTYPLATGMSPGPAPYEQGQALTFLVTNNTNPALFAAGGGPAIDPVTGVLTYTPAPNQFGTADVTVVLQDDGGTTSGGVDTSAAATFTITVTPVADPPAVSGTLSTLEDHPTGTITVGRNAVDGAEVKYVLITNVHGGTLALAAGGAVADGTYLDVSGGPVGLVFTPALNANSTDHTPAGGFGFTAAGALSATDTTGGSTPVVITVTAVDDAPVVGGLPASTPYLVGQSGAAIAPAATVTDVDSPTIGGGVLTVDYASGSALSGDALSVQPSADNNVQLGGTTVYVNGSPVGTISGGANGTALTVTFLAGATPDDAAAVLRSVVFSATGGAADRNLTVTVSDGAGGATSDPASTTVHVTDRVTVLSLARADASPTRALTDLHWTLTTDLPEGSGFALSNFALTGSLSGSATLTGVTQDTPTTYTITASLAANAGSGDLGLDVANDAGLSAQLSTVPFSGELYTVDRDGPKVQSVVSRDADGVVPVNQPTYFDVTFDEPVASVAAGSFIALGQPTADVTTSVAGNVVTVAVTPHTGGTFQLKLLATGAVLDALGNDDPAAYTDATVLTVDAGIPTVSSVTNNTSGSVANVVAPGQDVTFTVTFSKPMASSTVTTAAFSNGAAGTAAPVTIRSVTPVTAGASSTAFTVVVRPSSSGKLQLAVAATVTDVAGNPLAAAYTDPTVVTANVAPTAVADAYATNEDTRLVVSAANGLLANDTDPNDPRSSLTVDTTPFAAPTKGTLALAADGSFTYTPNPDANGTDTFQYRTRDPFGGVSAPAVVTITIAAVNDPPTFVLNSTAVTVLEDQAYGPTTIASQLGSGGSGAYVEGDGLVGFTVTQVSGDSTLTFTTFPSIDLVGNPGSQVGQLRFTPAANAFGTATFEVTLTDAGSNAAPNSNTSAPQRFTITVTPVNDAPSFALAGNPPVAGPGPQVVPNFATFDPGPNEQTAGQTPTYTLTLLGTSGTLAFASPPAIDSTGTLTYTPAAGTTGTATVRVAVKDSGGTADGGQDTGPFTQTFTIVVRAQAALPTANPDGSLVPKDAAATFIDVLANDAPAANGDRSLTVVSVTQPAHGTAAVAPGGRGVLYTPAAGFTGTDTFTYTLNDGNGGPATAAVDVVVRPVPAGQPRFDVVAVGTGPGGGPVVRVNSLSTGSFTATFAAYDPTFRGGVSVAVGDVNGDGVPDVVVTPGAGGGPNVKVLDGSKLGLVGPDGMISDAAVLYSFFAYEPTFTGGVTVAVADVDGDGKADIITGTGPGGGAHVRVLSGAKLGLPNSADGEVNLGAQLASFFAYDPSFRGGVNVAAGDVDGDGTADIVTAAGAGGGSHVKVFNGLGGQPLLRSFFAYGAGFTGGVNVAVGDVNGDGRADIITGAGVGGGPHVKVFDSSSAEIASFFGLSGDAAGADVAYRVTAKAVPLVVVGSQLGASQVRSYAAPDFLPYNDFTAYEDTFLGGVDVG